MGDCRIAGNRDFATMLVTMTTTENMKQTQTDALLVRFQYKPYRKGARNAPASAPQLTPISCAIKVTLDLYWMIAITTEMVINTAIRIRIIKS